MASLRNNLQPQNNGHRSLPEVADPCPESIETVDSWDEQGEETQEFEQREEEFKVFMKRNMAYLTPPSDLLANIYNRIDAIEE